MKGVVVRSPGAAFEVVTDIEKPKPGVDQILVKSIATAINPVYAYLIPLELLPAILNCCDTSG